MTSEPQMQLLEIATLSTSLTTTEIRSEMKWGQVAQSCPTLCNHMDCSLPGSSHPWDFPGKNSGVICHFLLQEIFPTQGLNSGLPHCRQMLYCLEPPGNNWKKWPPNKITLPKIFIFLLASYHLGIIYGLLIYNTNVLAYTYDQDRGRKGS